VGLAALASDAMQQLPQVLRNVRVDRLDPSLVERLRPDTARVEARLGESGRVLVRASGTEPLLRVMVEAATSAAAVEAADELVDALSRLAPLPPVR
jgi:phosphoglucosamine mutase